MQETFKFNFQFESFNFQSFKLKLSISNFKHSNMAYLLPYISLLYMLQTIHCYYFWFQVSIYFKKLTQKDNFLDLVTYLSFPMPTLPPFL